MASKRKKSQIRGAPPWMVTMGDMNNLLMCFFIVLMGDISEPVKQEMLMTATTFKGSLGVMAGGRSISQGRLAEFGHNIMTLPSGTRGAKLDKALKRAMAVLKAELETKRVRIGMEERGLIITLASDAFFDSGSARIRPEMRPVLEKIAGIIKSMDNFVRVEGHTDNNPFPPEKAKETYATNWELSGSRSINVLRFLNEEQDVRAEQLSAVAFGQYRPIDDNNTPEGRAYNRRVDICILKERFVEKSTHPKIGRPLPDEEWR